jgi:hypothetical protein
MNPNPTWEKLQTLRDEVRLKMHLAGMDAKDEWNKLEALMPDMQREVEKAVGTTMQASIDDVIKRLEKLRASLEKK